MTSLLGQDAQAAALMEAARTDRLHHAWLLAGPKGLGKASFARAAALRLLAEAAGPPPGGAGLHVSEDHPAARLMAAWSHPDFALLDRLPKDPKERSVPRVERTGNEELARNISIEQIRGLQALFATTASQSMRRVVMIDAIDDLERAAANALLKNLEEPPTGTVFLLVSHAPGRLLPTIRSRCRLLRFKPLDDAAMAVVLRAELPGADNAEIEALVRAGEGAPGHALRFAGLDVAAIETALEEMARSGDPTNATRSALARSLALKAAQPRYEAFLERTPAFIADVARRRSGIALAEAIDLWERARDLSASAVGLSLDPQSVAFELGGIVAGLAPRTATAKG